MRVSQGRERKKRGVSTVDAKLLGKRDRESGSNGEEERRGEWEFVRWMRDRAMIFKKWCRADGAWEPGSSIGC